jgi:hypothetical protein
MRFPIVPNLATPCDLQMVGGLAADLEELGHQAVALGSPLPAEPYALATSLREPAPARRAVAGSGVDRPRDRRWFRYLAR